ESVKINLYKQKFLREAGHTAPFFRTMDSPNNRLFFLFKNKIDPISSLFKFSSSIFLYYLKHVFLLFISSQQPEKLH
ncbi:MAG TPA: hypothetical protein PLT47_09460, partial [Bacteroidales bacterium]|nr:hypothetical protein [Bacteroidales bacterium]